MAPVTLPTTTKLVNTTRASKGVSSASGNAGLACYLDANGAVDVATKVAATGKYGVVGVLVCTSGGAGQNVYFAPAGETITVSGLTAGTCYYLHTSGALCLFSDLTTGDRVVLVGIALAATSLYLICYDTGITL